MLVKNNKGKEVDKGWTCDLVPKALIVARYFAAEQEAITKLEAELESIAAQMTELEEEHGKLVWSFDIKDPKSPNVIEVNVDAKTGRIVSKKIETPADEAKEKKADAAKK